VLAVSIPSGAVVNYDLAGVTSLQSITSTGTLGMAGGTLSISGALSTAGFTQSAGSMHAHTLAVTQSFAQTGGSINLSGGASITHNLATPLKLATLTASSVELVTGAHIEQHGPLTTEVLDMTMAADKVAELTNAGNMVASILMAGGSLTLINTAAPLEIATFSGPFLTIENTGGIVTTGAVNVPVGATRIISHSPITIGANGITAGGDILLTSTGTGGNDNITVNGPLTSTGGAIQFQSADAVIVNANLNAATFVTATAGTSATYAPGVNITAPSVSGLALDHGSVLTPGTLPASATSTPAPAFRLFAASGATARLQQDALNVLNGLGPQDDKKEDRAD
jgi:hypothetical protein